MVCYSHLFKNFPRFVVIHTVKGFGVVNKAEVDVFFLEFSCFFNDPMDVGNLISGSSAFSKSSLNIWKFTIHILLKAGLENFVSAGFPAVGGTIPGEASNMVRPLSPCLCDSPSCPSVLLLFLCLLLLLRLQI